jgi:hypothetical protein
MLFRLSLEDKGTAAQRSVVFIQGDWITSLLPTEHSSVVALATGSQMIFDFSSIGRINSVGVRSLLLLCKDVSESSPLDFRRCVPEITEQFCLLPEFLRYGRLQTLLVTEECPNPHNTPVRAGPRQREIKVGQEIIVTGGVVSIVSAHCNVCGAELERLTHEEPILGYLADQMQQDAS